MKIKWTTVLAEAAVLTMIFSPGFQPVIAAPPTGEVKTVAASLGNMVPVPYLEAAAGNDWMDLLYDPLVGCTADGKSSTETGVARKWEVSNDGLTWTFYLRKGIKFHDGVELTAKDVKFSIEQLMLPESSSDTGIFIKRELKSIELKDPYTVAIHLKQPYMLLPNLFNIMDGTPGMVVPKDYFERVGKDEFLKHPIGSGPYKFHSMVVGSFIKLEATDKHWFYGVPRYKYVSFQIIPEESSRIAMLRTGEADITRISLNAAKEVQNAGLNVITKENNAAVVFHCNMQWASPVFSDIRFRKALNLAIDREAMIKQIFVGLAKPMAAYPGSNILSIGGDPALKPYPYDPQEARRLIKEGGWEGYEFTLISYDRPGCPEFSQVVEALAGYWLKIGLRPKIRMSEWVLWHRAWREKKTQNTIHGFEDTTNPDTGSLLIKFKERWYSKGPVAIFNVPEVDERFERIEKSMNVDEVARQLAEIYRITYDQYLMIPICEFPGKIATTKRTPQWDPGLRRNDRNYYDLIKQR